MKEIEIFKKYIDVLFRIQIELVNLKVSFNYMGKFQDDDILANLRQIKDYETYLIGILNSKIESINTEINDKIKEIKEITSDETTVLNNIESDTDKSLINLIKNLEILESIYSKYMKGKTSVYLNLILNEKLINKIIKINNENELSIKCYNSEEKQFKNFKISVDNVKLNKEKKFLDNLNWENIKNKTTFLFQINFNTLTEYNIEKMLEDIIVKYPIDKYSIKLNRIIENQLDYDSKFTEMTEQGNTVKFNPDGFKGKQKILRTNQEKIIILNNVNYKNELKKIKDKKSHIFYEIEITDVNVERRPQVETATVILCDTAKLESPKEIFKSFYIDGKHIDRAFMEKEKNAIKGNTSYRDINLDNIKDITKNDKEIYGNWDNNKEPDEKQLVVLNKLRTYIQNRIKEEFYVRESIKHLVKFLSKDGTLPTMKNNELLLTNYDNTYVKTITEQDTTEITNIITELISKKPYNFIVITNLKCSEPTQNNNSKVSEFDCVKIEHILEFLDKIERT